MKRVATALIGLAVAFALVIGASAFSPEPGLDSQIGAGGVGLDNDIAGGDNSGDLVVVDGVRFINAQFDTSDNGSSSDVYLLVRGAATGRKVVAQWQWKQYHDDTWWPATPDAWRSTHYTGSPSDSTYAYIFTDTISTGISRANLDSFHVQFRAKATVDTVVAWRYGNTFALPVYSGDGIAPPDPGNLMAGAATGYVSLDWDDASSAASDFDHYRIYRSVSLPAATPDASDYAEYENPAGSASAATDLYASNGDSVYWYYITALDDYDNESGSSNISYASPTTNAAPDAPSGVYAYPGDQSVALEWTANTESDFKSYRAYRQSEVDGPFGLLPVSLIIPNFTDTGSDLPAGALTNGIEYSYYITATDWDDQESAPSDTVSATPADPTWIDISVINADFASGYINASGDSLTVELSITLSKDAYVKTQSWYYHNNSDDQDASGVAPTDTSGSIVDAVADDPLYNDWHLLETTGDVQFDTRIPSPAAVADSTILLEWKLTDYSAGQDASAPSVIILERWHNHELDTNGDQKWEVVCQTISGSSTSFRHAGTVAADTLVSVLRGVEHYRIYGISGTVGNIGIQTDYDYLDSPYYNQAVEVFFKVDASDGTYMDSEPKISAIYAAKYTPGADTTPPVVAYRFDLLQSGETLADSTASSNIVLNLVALSNEQAKTQWQWHPSESSDGWTPADSLTRRWSSTTAEGDSFAFAATQRDTIHTGYQARDGLGGLATLDSFIIRMRSKDAAGNVSAWAYKDTVFDRADEAAAGSWDGTIVISNSTTAYGDSAGTTWVTDEVYAAALDMSSAMPYNNSNTDWGDVTDSDIDPFPPFGSRWSRPYGAYPGGLRFSEGAGSRSYPFFSFGSSDELIGGTVNSATLYLKTAQTEFSESFSNMVSTDSVYLYSCARDTVLHQWLDATNPNDNISYTNADVSGSVAWLKDVVNWDTSYEAGTPNPMFGMRASFSPTALGQVEGDWISFNVKRLIDDQVAYGAPLMFYMCFNSEDVAGSNLTRNFTAFHNMGYDNGNGGSAQADRPYLVLDVTGVPAEDTTPPVVSTMSLAVFDTSDTGNVQLNLAATTNEVALGWWQFKHLNGGTWYPVAKEWWADTVATRSGDASADSIFSTSLIDTIMTTYSTTELDSFYLRLYVKDEAQNESAAYDPTDFSNPEVQKFIRYDSVPPDTTDVFASVVFDTTNQSNVKITWSGTSAEPVDSWLEWKQFFDGSWAPAENWEPDPRAEAISRSVWTGLSTESLAEDTLYTQIRLRDASLNVSVAIDSTHPMAMFFARQTDVTPPDTGSTFVSVDLDSTSTGTNDVIVVVWTLSHPSEAIKMWPQSAAGINAWVPSKAAWYPSTADDAQFVVRDTTGDLTASSGGATIHTRFKISDVAGNESVWYPDKQMTFTRAAVAGGFTGHSIISNHATHPVTRSTDAVDSTTIDHWISDPTYCAVINMYDTAHTETGAEWGYAAGYDAETSPVPLSSWYYRSNVGGWHVTGGGASLRAYPLFSFGDTDDFAGVTVDTAKLWIRIENNAFSNMDSVFIYSMTGLSDPAQWANDNNDVSYVNADQSAATAWSPAVTAWTRESVGGVQAKFLRSTMQFGAVPTNVTFVALDVTTLAQDQIDNSKPFVFYMTFTNETSQNVARAAFNDNGTIDAAAGERFYLEIKTSE